MTEMMSRVEHTEAPNAVTGLDGLDEQLISQLVGRAKAGGLHSAPVPASHPGLQ